MSNWKEVELRDIIVLNYGKSLTEPERMYTGKIPVYSSSGITGWHDAALVNEKGIIIGRKGTIGTVFLSDGPFWCIDTAYYIKESELNINIYFVYYLLKYLNLSRLNFDSAVPGLNREIAYSEVASIPTSKEEISSIAKMLSILDKKIDNLKKQNEALETIAQTLFKHWFIDFEFPNAEGKPYKSSGGEMIDSFLGLIPKDWNVGKLGDEFNILMGQSPTGDSFNEKGVGTVFYQGRTDFGFRFPKIRLYTTEPKRMAEIADVLVSVRAPVGDINVAFENCCIGRGLAAVKSKFKSYCLYKIMSLKPQFKVFETEGTVFGSLNKDNFNNLEITIPDKKITEVFNKIVNSMDLKFFNNEKQMRKLADIKERLLPKLISGQVRIKE